jgi:oligoribonuclease
MKNNLVWIDLEMTGLHPEVDTIIEAACLITNTDLEIVAEGPDLVIQANPAVFESMDAWNKNQHTKSGLWEKVLASTITVEEAEERLLTFIKANARSRPYLAGNSIWQDRRFIRKYMPRLDEYLHYRMLDVSSIKIVVDYWRPKVVHQKRDSHRALDDVKESIEELKLYKDHIFLPREGY